MKFLIPSYMRADRQRTLRELLRLGVDKDDIFIGVQTRSDFDIYKNCADGFENIVYKPAHNLSGNYNNLLEEFRDHDVVALMDDDIRAIGYVREGGKGGKATSEQFRACIESMGDVVWLPRNDINLLLAHPFSSQDIMEDKLNALSRESLKKYCSHIFYRSILLQYRKNHRPLKNRQLKKMVSETVQTIHSNLFYDS